MRPTSCPRVGGRYLPVASMCLTSSAPEGTMDGNSRGCRGPSGGRFLARGKRPSTGGPEIRLYRKTRAHALGSSGVWWPATRATSQTQLAGPGGARGAQELGAPVHLLDLVDGVGSASEGAEGAQEAAVGLVLPRHRALPAPPRAAQRVEAAVVARAGVGVGLHRTLVGQRVLREDRPGQRRRGIGRGDLLGPLTAGQGVGGGVLGQVRRRDAEQVGAHGYLQVGAGGLVEGGEHAA